MPTIASDAWVLIVISGPKLKNGIGTGKTIVTVHFTLAKPSWVPSYLSSLSTRFLYVGDLLKLVCTSATAVVASVMSEALAAARAACLAKPLQISPPM